MTQSIIDLTYWITSSLVALWMATAALSIFLRKDFIHIAIKRLGYPEYFPWLLGVAKAMGMMFILLPVPTMLKHFSYAGAIFELIAAAVSYYIIDRKFSEWIKPVILLAIVIAAYFFWKLHIGVSIFS